MPKILVIDDSSMDRKIVSMIIKKNMATYEIIEADSFEAAKPYLDDTALELVITDLNMPDITGFTVIEFIRKNEKTSTLPILVISGTKESESKNICQELGANVFLKKPLSPPLLMECLDYLLAKTNVESQEAVQAIFSKTGR